MARRKATTWSKTTLFSLAVILVLGISVVYFSFVKSDPKQLRKRPHRLNARQAGMQVESNEEVDLPGQGQNKPSQGRNKLKRGPRNEKHQADKQPKPIEQPYGVRMAMDGAKSMQDRIINAQRSYIQNHKGPPDHIYNINETLRDSFSLDRPIEDKRRPVCRAMQYSISELPVASVVVPFYNEALALLLRTIHSVLNRSPDQLLQEIIVVDDKSTYEYLHKDLENYLGLLPKVVLLRNKNHEGLVKSRMNGVRIAKGKAVIFLDAGAEANVGWLEPLLWELKKQPNSIVQPFVDGIDVTAMGYSTSPTDYMYRGAFTWDLRYVWIRVPDATATQVLERGEPLPSATLAGVAIAVDMEYFKKIGYFDEGIKVWGGENIELAFRTWMCGGRVVTAPCSRVGHVFKKLTYKFDAGKLSVIQKNLMRIAEIWMDDYKKYFYASTTIYDNKRVTLTAEETQSLVEGQKLREQLQCKSFAWYMKEILPEVEEPPMDSVFYGEIMNFKSRACFEVLKGGVITMTYYCSEHKIIPENLMRISKTGLLLYHGQCVGINPPHPSLTVVECPEDESTLDQFGRWSVELVGETFGYLRVAFKQENGEFGVYCVMQVTNALPEHKELQMPQLYPCEKSNEFQLWAFTHEFDFENIEQTYVNFSEMAGEL